MMPFLVRFDQLKQEIALIAFTRADSGVKYLVHACQCEVVILFVGYVRDIGHDQTSAALMRSYSA